MGLKAERRLFPSGIFMQPLRRLAVVREIIGCASYKYCGPIDCWPSRSAVVIGLAGQGPNLLNLTTSFVECSVNGDHGSQV